MLFKNPFHRKKCVKKPQDNQQQNGSSTSDEVQDTEDARLKPNEIEQKTDYIDRTLSAAQTILNTLSPILSLAPAPGASVLVGGVLSVIDAVRVS